MTFSTHNHFNVNDPIIKKIMAGIPHADDPEYPYDDTPSTSDHDGETHGIDPSEIGIGNRKRDSVNEDSTVGPPVELHTVSKNNSDFQKPTIMKKHDELSNHYKFTNGTPNKVSVNHTHVYRNNRGEPTGLGGASDYTIKNKEEDVKSTSAPAEHYDAHFLRKYTSSSNGVNYDLHTQHKKLMTDTGMGHVAAGRKVHTKISSWTSNRVTNIDRALTTNKTPSKLSLYTGVKFNPHNLAKDKILHLAAYTSTSIDPKTAIDFAKHDESDGHKDRPVRHAIRLHWPKNSHGAYVAHFSEFPGEHEFVLPRNVGLKLSGHHEIVEHHGDTYHIHHAYPVYGHK